MKFLLNMNMSRELGKLLISQGHEYRHVGDIGLARAEDIDIVAEAKEKQEIILTHDLDYGNLLAFSGESVPSVIIFRVRNTQPKNMFIRLMDTWPKIQLSLIKGAMVILEEATLRIRELPIRW
jgi:predicted nuclease of predicted toxin-antitoxin system